MLSFFPRGVLDEILNLIESVSEEFPSYSYQSTHCEALFIRSGRLKRVKKLCSVFISDQNYLNVIMFELAIT